MVKIHNRILSMVLRAACYRKNYLQFVKFVLVGIVNTGVGYGVIFGCMYLANMPPELSNLIGYMFGLLVSYTLHRNYTFGSTGLHRKEFVRFVFTFLVAYVANLLVLIFLVRIIFISPFLAQFISGAVYVAISYLLNKFFVFRSAVIR